MYRDRAGTSQQGRLSSLHAPDGASCRYRFGLFWARDAGQIRSGLFPHPRAAAAAVSALWERPTRAASERGGTCPALVGTSRRLPCLARLLATVRLAAGRLINLMLDAAARALL